jgi:hypothetical protein
MMATSPSRAYTIALLLGLCLLHLLGCSRADDDRMSNSKAKADSVTTQLEGIAAAGDDFESQSHKLTVKWGDEPKRREVLEAILRFMERHPEIEYGTPGALVHFVETFPGYEETLVESVEHQPTPHTAWMLNRVINGKRDDPKERRAFMLVMEHVLVNGAADAPTRDIASDFLEFHRRKN